MKSLHVGCLLLALNILGTFLVVNNRGNVQFITCSVLELIMNIHFFAGFNQMRAALSGFCHFSHYFTIFTTSVRSV